MKPPEIYPFILNALAVILVVIFVVSLPAIWELPWTGIVFDRPSKVIIEVAPDSLNAVNVHVGDIIVAINGKPLPEATPTYQLLEIGETVTYTLLRGTKTVFVEVFLGPPASFQQTSRLIHMLLGAIFWGLGITIFYRKRDDQAARTFLLLCLSAVAVFISLDLSASQLKWATYVSQFGILFSAASFLHFHTLFPLKRSANWLRLARLFYFFAFSFLLIYFSVGVYQIAYYSWYPLFSIAITSYLLISFIIGLALLVQAWLLGDGPTRRRIRLTMTGTVLGVIPLILVILFGELSIGRFYEIGIISLVFIPMAYAYALYRDDLLPTDLVLYRFIAIFLLALTLLVIYLAGIQLIYLIQPAATQSPLAGGLVSLVIAFSFGPIRAGIEYALNRLFVGVGYNYLNILTPAIHRLSDLDREALIEVLTVNIPLALKVEQAALWLIEEDTLDLEWIGGGLKHSNPSLLVQNPDWWSRLRKGQPIALPKTLLPPIRMVVPLVGALELQGIWLIGERAEDESFSPLDQRLMAATAQSAALVVKVMNLLEALRIQLKQSQAARAELAAAYRKLTQIRDDERHQLALKLHDDVLQSLIGFQMFFERASEEEKLSDQLRENLINLKPLSQNIVVSTRRVCQDLRPPALEKGGLLNGLRTLITEIDGRYNLSVALQSNIQNISLPPDVETALYRITQEALTNVGKHAQASQVVVQLQLSSSAITLVISDNGQGFDINQVKGRRFGLLSLRERAIAISGQLIIDSTIGKGTVIQAHIPVKEPLDEIAA